MMSLPADAVTPSCLSGKVTMNVAPLPSDDSTFISPLWASTTLCTMLNPSPVPPFDSRVSSITWKKGLNIFS